MKDNGLKELLVMDIQKKIKGFFLNKIDIHDNNLNLNNRMDVVDEKFASVLVDLFDGELLTNLVKYTGEKKEVQRSKTESYLVLYYTAMYFDNVSLLKEMLNANYSTLESADELNLCLLDSEISKLFDDCDYLEILSRYANVFESFYESIRKIEGLERHKYLTKFSEILKARKDLDFSRSERNDHFSKNNLDNYETETYLKVDKETIYYGFSETLNVPVFLKARFNELLKSGFKIHFSGFLVEKTLTSFSDEELIKMSQNELKAYNRIIQFGDKYLNRAKNIFSQRKNFINYDFCSSKAFYNMFSDEMILSLTDEEIRKIANQSDLFKELYRKNFNMKRVLNLFREDEGTIWPLSMYSSKIMEVFTDQEIISISFGINHHTLSTSDLKEFLEDGSRAFNKREKTNFLIKVRWSKL